MFSITLVNIDSYQASPIPELDVTVSEFRGSEIRKVPVIRIFGSTTSGKKTCLHIHGVFPYIYVPCMDQENTDSFAYQLASAIDLALNTSFGFTRSTNQHVYKIQRVSGVPFYGYHEKEHLFFKIYFYNPAVIKKTAELLQNGTILNKNLQPYEAHIPYILQFMIDYNLYGMNLINLNNIKYRYSLQECTTEDSQDKTSMLLLDTQTYLPTSITRQSMCELEVDAHASDITNRESITKKLELNPGLAAIWNEEKARRAKADLENAKSQLLYPRTPSKIILPPTDNDVYQEIQLLKRLTTVSQTSETATTSINTSSYPIEVEDNEDVLNASHVLCHSQSLISVENIEKRISNDDKLLQSVTPAILEENQSQNNITDTSFLDADDIPLVEMLAGLAEENEIASNIDDDSVLGSQYSLLSQLVKNDLEEEEEVEDLNITSLDLESLSSWELVHKNSGQSSGMIDSAYDKNDNNHDHLRNSNDIEQICENVTSINLPQFDGVDDSYENISEYEKKDINILNNTTRCTAVQHLSKNINRVNIRNNRATCDLQRKLCLTDVIKYIVNSPNRYYLEKHLYNFINRYCFHIFVRTGKNFQSINVNADTDAVIKKMFCVQDSEIKIVCNKIKEELRVTRCQLDHRDLDVYDVDEIGIFETLENNQNYGVNNNENEYICQLGAKTNVPRRTCSSTDYHLYRTSPNCIKQFTILGVDGPTVTDSSDSESESEADVTIDRQEKRICAYKSCKKNALQNMVHVTPKKRRLDFDDDHRSSANRKNTEVKTPKRKCYNSPNKTPRSPRCLSGNYSPLNITVTSPKTCKSPTIRQRTLGKKQYLLMSDIPSTSATLTTSTTPKRDTRPLHVKLLCDKRTNLLDANSENNVSDNVREESTINETYIVQNADNTSSIEADETIVAEKSTRNYEQRIDNSESSQVRRSKEVRKRLYFLNYDELENTHVESDHHASQSENLIAFGHLVDRAHADANVFSSSNENNEDIASSPSTEKINNDMSPDRYYASSRCSFANKSTKSHDEIISETDLDEDEEDTYNTTFTQHLNQKLDSDSQKFSSDRNQIYQSPKNLPITITAKYKPPSPERILQSMTLYGIPKCRWEKPFFSNKLDLAKHKESSNAPNFDIPAFKSSLEDVTSIKLWRRMKVNEFYPSGSNIKSCHLKRTLAGYDLLTIKPLATPPSPRNVKNWVKAKKYLSKKDRDAKIDKQDQEKILGIQNVQDSSTDILNVNDKFQSVAPHSDHSTSNVLSMEESLKLQQSGINETSGETRKFDFTQNSDNSRGSHISGDTLNPSLRETVENLLLHKQNKAEQQLGISYGQIEYSSKGSYNSNVSNENLQNVRVVATHQYLTLMSLEVHAVTREDLLPDPQYDSIGALFYAIYSDGSTDANEKIEHGAIIVNPCPVNARLNKIHSASAMCPILYVTTEQDIFNSLVKLIERYDPEILVGWEVEALSWGYVFQRASRLGLNGFPLKISKVPYTQIFAKSDVHASEKDDANEVKVSGRNILDVWRIMRYEAALLTYTFENVMHHVLHERIPCPSFRALSTWWKQEGVIQKFRVIRHYIIRVIGTIKILNHLDIIGRTCEHARLFGIQFYEVFSRGSQFRVESMMLRLAKPLNYIPISPSVHQRAKMRAPECLPLIMEPESEFYTDPLIVLDFQSLYPSMIIAYNYCFSTCLGRIEHIGQYEPFPFGAATLRVKKNSALKLQNKMNFSPCGVAFVKKEIRQGILPRMLSEILNTRLMVKESMKLHPAENRPLQRILHSQQLGLKLIANVTYGYTSANFSGRMPCIEIGDSVVSKGRETLERAIKLVESTPKWGARIVYGDTDSIFVLLRGKSREEAFTIGEEIADAVTAANPPPVKLKFEKVLHPSILQTKKRYCGYMYETRNQEKPEFLAKGIETIRRDGCLAVSKILEKALKILFDTKDISLVKLYITKQFDKIFRRRVSIQDLTFAKEFRGMHGYKANACVPALELTRRLIKKDPRAIPRTSERVRYVIVAGAPNQALIHCVRTPMEVITDPSLIPNSIYYITKVIIPPLNRCFNLFGIDVNTWYKEMSHRQSFDNIAYLGRNNPKSTIRQFFTSVACLTCGESTNDEICLECLLQPSRTVFILLDKIRQLEKTHQQIAAICHSCIGQLGDIECASLDCPVLYRMIRARKELTQVSHMNNIIYGNNCSSINGTNPFEWY